MDMPDGFIPLPPRVEPQAAFRPLLDDLRRTLARPPFERAVHSIYLYG
ncbi:DNA polymerase III subunit beta, partial [Pseudomonas aeruginosa]